MKRKRVSSRGIHEKGKGRRFYLLKESGKQLKQNITSYEIWGETGASHCELST